MKKIIIVLIVLLSVLPLTATKVSVSGLLDADVTTDFKGGYTAGHELDLTLSVDLLNGVSVDLFTTAINGRVPAAGAAMDGATRWGNMVFDGVTLKLKDKLGKGSTVSLIDLVFQYGGMDAYYFYKRLSIITPETFLRGASFSKTSTNMSYSVLAGADSEKGAIISGSIKFGGISLLASFYEKKLNNAPILSVGVVVENLPLSGKLIIGGIVPVIDGSMETANSALNLAYSFSLGLGPQWSLAGMVMYTDDAYGVDNAVFGVNYENLLIYMEPGIKFSKYVAVGLPVELHKWIATAASTKEGEELWIVPTLYFYPTDGVEIWVWGQVVLAEGAEPGYFGGLETIVKF